MIQPLRCSHFRIWVLLPVLMMALFAAGLVVRRSTMPENTTLHWERYK